MAFITQLSGMEGKMLELATRSGKAFACVLKVNSSIYGCSRDPTLNNIWSNSNSSLDRQEIVD